MHDLEIISLDKDEIEAIRLADFEQMHHEQAAKLMNISRATFGRILSSARFKLADSILNGKAIQLSSENLSHIKIILEGE